MPRGSELSAGDEGLTADCECLQSGFLPPLRITPLTPISLPPRIPPGLDSTPLLNPFSSTLQVALSSNPTLSLPLPCRSPSPQGRNRELKPDTVGVRRGGGDRPLPPPPTVPLKDAYSPIVKLAGWRVHAPAVATLLGRVLQRLHAYEALARWVVPMGLPACMLTSVTISTLFDNHASFFDFDQVWSCLV